MVPFFIYTCYMLFVSLVYTRSVSGQCLIITEEEIGNLTSPSASGLISQARGLEYHGGVNPQIHVLAYSIVCTSAFSLRGTFRYVSLIANYTELNHTDPDSAPQLYSSQFDFDCQDGLNVWRSSESGNHGITTPPNASFSTPLREDCGICRGGSFGRNENHCKACTGCDLEGLNLCHAIAVCCNYYFSDKCVLACPNNANTTTENPFDCICETGYVPIGRHCDYDECSTPNPPCLDGQICINTRGGYECETRCPTVNNYHINMAFPNITLSWNSSKIGESQLQECPCLELSLDSDTIPYASRMCGGNDTTGAEWGPVNLVECGLTDIGLSLCQSSKVDSIEEQSNVLLKQINRIGARDDPLRDLTLIVDYVEKLTSEAINADREQVRENYLTAIDEILKVVNSTTTTDGRNSSIRQRLIATLDEFRDNVQLPDNVTEMTYSRDTFTIHVADVQPNEFTAAFCEQDDSAQSLEGNCSVEVTPGMKRQVSSNAAATVRVNREAFSCNDEENTTRRLSHSAFLQGGLVLFDSFSESQSNWTILSGVVVSVNINRTQGELQSSESCASQLIEVYIPLPENSNQHSEVENSVNCGLWDYNDGSWNTHSCTWSIVWIVNGKVIDLNNNEQSGTLNSNKGEAKRMYRAKFPRLGHFGFLLDLMYGSGEELPFIYTFTLGVISYVGLGVSVVCLMLLILTYLFTKPLRSSEHGQILINISVSLICLYLTFLMGAHSAPVPVLCSISAALLQYFMLVFFGWTAMESIYLYRKLVKVMVSTEPKIVLYAALIVWLLPLLIVALSAGPGYVHYINEENAFCRAKKLPFWLGLILPFLVVYIFNWVMFVIIMVSLCKHSTAGKGSGVKNLVNNVKKQLMIAVGLATLFGLGWGFGLAASSTPAEFKELTFAFQIVFSIFVGFQGVLFFILHGIRSPIVRGQWTTWVSRMPTSKIHSGASRTGVTDALSKSRDNTSKADTDILDKVNDSVCISTTATTNDCHVDSTDGNDTNDEITSTDQPYF